MASALALGSMVLAAGSKALALALGSKALAADSKALVLGLGSKVLVLALGSMMALGSFLAPHSYHLRGMQMPCIEQKVRIIFS